MYYILYVINIIIIRIINYYIIGRYVRSLLSSIIADFVLRRHIDMYACHSLHDSERMTGRMPKVSP